MNIYSVFKNKIRITFIVALLAGMHVLWDYYHGGIPTHHILAEEDMPGFSNLWGLLTLPLLTLGLITLTQKRVRKYELLNPEKKKDFSEILIGFFGSLTFGIILSLLWELGFDSILQYLIFLPIVISLIRPLHFPEYLLGFVLGMAFTFGGVLPIIIGIVILLMCFIANSISKGVLFLASKIIK